MQHATRRMGLAQADPTHPKLQRHSDVGAGQLSVIGVQQIHRVVEARLPTPAQWAHGLSRPTQQGNRRLSASAAVKGTAMLLRVRLMLLRVRLMLLRVRLILLRVRLMLLRVRLMLLRVRLMLLTVQQRLARVMTANVTTLLSAIGRH